MNDMEKVLALYGTLGNPGGCDSLWVLYSSNIGMSIYGDSMEGTYAHLRGRMLWAIRIIEKEN